MRPLHRVLIAASVALGLSAPMADATVLGPYFQTNLVSDIAGLAPVTDPNLQNPWGVSESATSPLWISDQHAGVATLYTVHGLSATPAGPSRQIPPWDHCCMLRTLRRTGSTFLTAPLL